MASQFILMLIYMYTIYEKTVCTTFGSTTQGSTLDWHFAGPNIALHKTASQFPGTFSDPYPTYKLYPASLAVDGNDDSDFVHGSCSHTSASYEGKHIAQWKVELDSAYNITGIIIVNRKVEDDVRDRLKDFIVYKNCGNLYGPWCEIYNDKSKMSYKEDVINIPVDGQEATEIVINLPSQGSKERYLTLCEVKIYAAKPACETITSISNGDLSIYNNTGVIVGNKYTTATVLRFNCHSGFVMNGSMTVECLGSGSFDHPIPSCIHTCPNIVFGNGYITPNKILYKETEIAHVICNIGFETNVQSIRCGSNGIWSVRDISCNRILCDLPKSPANAYYMKINGGSINESEHLPYNSTIEGKCHTCFETNTDNRRSCRTDKTWSGTEPSCIIKHCPSPVLQNGKYINRNDGMSIPLSCNTTLTALCDKGYKLIGDANVICKSNKKWDNQPVCTIVTCEYPGIPLNGTYIINGKQGSSVPYTKGLMNFSDEIQLQCSEGNMPITKSYVRRCQENGSWSGENGKCGLINCQRPEQLSNGYYNFSNPSTKDGYPFRTVVTAFCNTTFKLSKPENKTSRCTEDGLWDVESFVCTDPDRQSMTGVIAGTAAGGTVILFIVSAILVIVYRRRKIKEDTADGGTSYFKDLQEIDSTNRSDGDYDTVQERHSSPPLESNYETISLEDHNKRVDARDGYIDVPYSTVADSRTEGYYTFTDIDKIPETAITLKELPDLVLTGDEAKRTFDKEFEGLPKGLTEPHYEATKLQNRGKNRYRNLFAYDATRVVLETDYLSTSDYINACYIDGFEKGRRYIAAQGPTKETLEDFWRMILQTKCGKVVMLTNLREEGKMKCMQYWPDKDSASYGRINVTHLKTEMFSQFVIREFSVSKDGEIGTSKTVTQFHFTAWPDRGVPKYASSLVHFLSKVKYFHDYQTGPVVVHCSAGVGRTGTFIALDFLTEQGKAMGYVDVKGVLTALRKQRVNLVQTLEQYIFVHHALVESLMLPTSALPASKFPEVFQELLQMDVKKKKLKMNVEFETLKKVSPVTDEGQYVSSNLVQNRQKNRYSNVLPVEEFMPPLSDGLGGDDGYINAVFLPSYKIKNAFIITQTPLKSTKQDFWNMIWEHDIHNIVMMNNIEEMKENEIYWPDEGETTSLSNIEIMNTGEEENNGHIVVSLEVKKYAMTRKIQQIRCGGWPVEKDLPNSPDVILTLMELVQSFQQRTGNHTILVHCMNGANKSGLFCVISAVIERMKIEQDVAISHVIEVMRNAREQIIPNVDQFKFCHEAVLVFLDQYETYSNFAG